MARLKHIKRRRDQAKFDNLISATNRRIAKMQLALDGTKFSFDGRRAIVISHVGSVLQRKDNSKVVLRV